tara:strand:+ start:333 stop:1748 length:1416 start_codon:yes stop_codon:yes gene_type:complete
MKYPYYELLAHRWTLYAKNNDTNALLNLEISDYHKVTKDPDTGDNFRRFYTILEPLYIYASKKELHSWSNGQKKLSLSLLSNSYLKNSHVSKNSKVIVLKGPIDLAHGDVLKKQIKNANNRKNLVLILFDYDEKQAVSISSQLDCKCIGLANISPNINVLNRYKLIVEFLLFNNQYIKSCVWWGIPFGMTFTYNLLVLTLKLLNIPRTISLEYLTVKHHFSWSSHYIDTIYTSLPLVKGFDTSLPKIKYFPASFYDPSEFQSLNTSEKSVTQNLKIINYLRKQGCHILSSVSRAEKTDDQTYIDVLQSILSYNKKTVILIFGKNLPDSSKQLVNKFSNKRVLYLGWVNNIIPYINSIDIFLDPFPFGAGMTFVAASALNKPCISTDRFVNSSPSTISILKYLSQNNNLNNELIRKYKKYLFADIKNYPLIVEEIICGLQSESLEISEYINLLRQEILKHFCESTTSMLSEM